MLPLTPLYSLSVLLPDRTEMGWPSHTTEVAMTTQHHYVTLRAFLTQHTVGEKPQDLVATASACQDTPVVPSRLIPLRIQKHLWL